MSSIPAPFDSGQKKIRGIVLVSLAVLCFAVLDSMTKYLSRYYAVPSLVWVRYMVHMLVMLALFGPRMRLGLVRTARPGLQILRALLLLCTSLLFISGLRYIPLAEATAINFVAPLLVTALSVPLLGDRVDRRDGLAVLLGFVGVLIIVRPGGPLLSPAILLPLAAAVCFSLYQIMTRKFSRVENPITTHCKAEPVVVATPRLDQDQISIIQQKVPRQQAGCSEHEIFIDQASGARADRPGLEACLQVLEPGDTLLVWRLGRLGRSMPHLVMLIEELLSKRIGFHSRCDGAIDTTTASWGVNF